VKYARFPFFPERHERIEHRALFTVALPARGRRASAAATRRDGRRQVDVNAEQPHGGLASIALEIGVPQSPPCAT